MRYTVHQLANLSGISVRTLHYYDEIGLLKPSYVADNGYRYYEEVELFRLQQILFFKELDFSLENIGEIMHSTSFNRLEALQDQQKLLEKEQKRILKLLITIEKTINSLKKGEKMNTADIFEPFTDEELEQLKQESKQKWGNTEAYKQSAERTKHWQKADYDRIKAEGLALAKKLALAMDLDIKSGEVQMLIKEHYASISIFYDCSLDFYKNLGKMYTEDPRFTKYYDTFRPGLAVWLQGAIEYYCNTQEESGGK
ncbi:MerR family transcriptional regulator [Candidatus Woesebacteria bacterium]|nr:MerR family transcriptional regulator [Candidatus Woesebacteria bacterium]